MVRLAPSSRLLATLLALVLALALGACGGGDSGKPSGVATAPAGGAEPGASVPGTVPEAAALVPAAAPVFLSFDTNFGSDQWTTLDALLAKFPSGDQAIASLLKQVAGEGVDVETELKPALGPETSIAILELDQAALASQSNAPIVLLTKPSDGAKLEALLAKGEGKAVWKVTDDGWYVVADNQQIIDRVLQESATSSLASAPGFTEAMQSLAGDSFARLYLNGAPLLASLQQSLADSASGFDLGAFGLGSTGAGTLESVAMGLRAETGGVRIQGIVRTQGTPTPPTFEPRLQSIVPSGVLAYVSFANIRTTIEQFLELAAQQTPDFEQQLGQLEAGLGISLENDILPIFEGEHALYVRFAAPVPEITLLLSPPDPVSALASLDKLTSAIGLFSGASGGQAPSVTTTSIAGIPAKQVSFPDSQYSLYYAQVGQNLVFTTAVQGIADLVAPAGVLADDPLFVEATEQAGLSGASQGFVYVNPREGLSLLETFAVPASAIQIDPETLQSLQAIRYLILTTAVEQNAATFSGFLAIGE